MHQDYSATEFEDEPELTEPRRDDSEVCNKHSHVTLDRNGKCHICDLLKGRNRKFTKGRF